MLGYGDYYVPEDSQREDVPRYLGRRLFLKAVRKVEPQVLQTLLDETGSSWKSDRPKAEKMLNSWATKWHLADEWCLSVARRTVDFLLEYPAVTPFWYPGMTSYRDPFSDAEIEFTFSHPGWNPIEAPWQEHKRELRRAFNARLTEYHRQISDLAVSRGLEKTPRKRGGKAEHFEWLARYQVQEWTQTEIGRKYHREREAVGEAVRKTAELIGLTLRSRRSSG